MSQVETNWEAIIIDDESTDDTSLQVVPYLKSDKRIKYLKQVHGGAVMAKNNGIKQSHGRFVSFLDSDDEYEPFHLESRKSILLQNPTIKFLYGGTTILGNQFVPDRNDLSKMINLTKCAIGGTFFIERNTLLSLKGFQQVLLGADADLLERATAAGITMMETKLQTYIYHRETDNSVTNNFHSVKYCT